MAKKISTCAFCGKQINTNLLLGNEKLLIPADDLTISCCPDCYRQREKAARKVYNQLTAKVKNYMRVKETIYINDEVRLPMYEQYCRDREALQADRQHIDTPRAGYFFEYNEDGYFRWHEHEISRILDGVKGKCKTMMKGKNVESDVYHKDDIKFIRYRVSSHDMLNPFHYACTVELCVNDMDTISAKPQTTKFVVFTKGLSLRFQKKGRDAAAKQVEAFRKAIGSDLPIERVKKFF